jgi:hypothetical protein
VGILVFLTITFGQVRYTGSDARATLLVSESILKHGTIKLDDYGGEALIQRFGNPESKLDPLTYVLSQRNGHYYAYFPLGSAIASLPFVWLASGFGFEMMQHEAMIQIVIVSVLSVMNFILLFKIAGLTLPPPAALIAASVFWFGTSFSSALGSALWSHDFAVLFALLALYLSLLSRQEKRVVLGVAIAGSLFMSYLTRPTMALFVGFDLVFLWLFFRRNMLSVAFQALGLFLCFVSFSLFEYQKILPDYYHPQRLDGGSMGLAIVGNLISPSRGLLVFSPIIWVLPLCFGYRRVEANQRGWFLMAWFWPVLHLLAISRFPHWFGGYCYGPRLMSDALPGLFLIAIRSFPTLSQLKSRKFCSGVALLAGVFSIYANAYMGLYSQAAADWNASPDVDRYRQYLFDWQNPQFLASEAANEKRKKHHQLEILPDLISGEVIKQSSSEVVWINWSSDEGTHRWSLDRQSAVVFSITPPFLKSQGALEMELNSFGDQNLVIRLNGSLIYKGLLEGHSDRLNVIFDEKLLRAGKNSLEFEMPDAKSPGPKDTRILGVALRSFSVSY